MNKILLSRTLSALSGSLLSIVCGLLLLRYNDRILQWLLIGAGVLLIVMSLVPIMKAISGKVAMPPMALVAVIGGILLLAFHNLLTTLLFLFLGGLLLIMGALQLNQLISFRRLGFRVGMLNFMLPVLIIVAGIVAIVNPFTLVASLLAFVGWCITLHGLFSLAALLVMMFSRRTLSDGTL